MVTLLLLELNGIGEIPIVNSVDVLVSITLKAGVWGAREAVEKGLGPCPFMTSVFTQMGQLSDLSDAKKMAAEMAAELRTLPIKNTLTQRAVCRKYSQKIRRASPEFVIQLGKELLQGYGLRWQAYEIILRHKAAFQRIGPSELEMFGQGIDSWWSVDSFARTLSGPAWLNGRVHDELIHTWARSEDRWWRRAALVSTVALNLRSKGGPGDVPRTLAVCQLLVNDHDDVVAKAMSWALRELVVHDPQAVSSFLRKYDSGLASRVKREVQNKLTTGLKTPRAASG
jgi:3-methyladenine DNA glycosylase AlkD